MSGLHTQSNAYSITAVVPALNEVASIQQCIAALQQQEAPLTDIIVVDGGSTDGTQALAAEAGARVIQSPPGRARQMNAGARVACSDVLWFVHADTLVPHDATINIQGAIESGAVWGRFDIRLSGEGRAYRTIEWAMNRRSRWTGIATGDQAMFVRRDCFERLGGFPDLTLMEDVALSRELKRLRRPACLMPPAVTSSRRWEQQGVARTVWLMWRLRLDNWRGVDTRKLARRYGGRAP